MDYDQLYGPCEPPVRPISDEEYRLRPNSAMILDADSSLLLTAYLDEKAAFTLTTVFAQTYHVLWLIDRRARILFAVEEVLDEKDKRIGVLPRSLLARPVSYVRLGHPSLLADPAKAARIGGEIRFDPDFEPGFSWILTNESGRYGTRPWQTEAHMNEARRLFASFGLQFPYDFIPPLPIPGA
ncbi:MAG: hypothetical protein KUA43_06740 [Hoeflea sp.]|uniref:hypothetical protein n=1 Tax=Hoeflea sp. TaxID=1940281 RepID=UPI001E0AA0E9|nr:hypothetical protein [Hoeflea sp.]MBU4530094.1 hypothetical protein [Alphaproteobacteria bacterium]MBU4542621.1 hypothetical protein [Alphaproteobacteria bacterium]MBU4551302.1 hypothetical protein [Alphaproteobacteria bacterium]MBV1723125.1 hypothetical protein [Hoeflea sp.]MBV1760136.1 hypothetical protein [Hoeflea sp.]